MPNVLNPDHILGILRYTRDNPKMDIAHISNNAWDILQEHRDILNMYTSEVGPADAIYDMLQELLEGE
jgi:hypothetical protein